MKHFNVSFDQISSINDFLSDYSDLTVFGYNDDELTVSIKDKVLPGSNRPNGGKVMNNYSYRYLEVSVDKKGNVTKFTGYIQAGYGYEEFTKESAFATPLYKKNFVNIDDLNLKIFSFLERQQKAV